MVWWTHGWSTNPIKILEMGWLTTPSRWRVVDVGQFSSRFVNHILRYQYWRRQFLWRLKALKDYKDVDDDFSIPTFTGSKRASIERWLIPGRTSVESYNNSRHSIASQLKPVRTRLDSFVLFCFPNKVWAYIYIYKLT